MGKKIIQITMTMKSFNKFFLMDYDDVEQENEVTITQQMGNVALEGYPDAIIPICEIDTYEQMGKLLDELETEKIEYDVGFVDAEDYRIFD